MEALWVLLIGLEAIGILLALIIIIPISIHAELEDWATVKYMKRQQIWCLLAPIACVYLLYKGIKNLIYIYRHD